jgi:hypothetical protein
MDIAAILLLATSTEAMVEYVFGQSEAMKPYMHYVALAVGIFLAIAYNIDIPAMLNLEANFGLVDNVFSGRIIGRSSNYVNDLISKIRGN